MLYVAALIDTQDYLKMNEILYCDMKIHDIIIKSV